MMVTDDSEQIPGATPEQLVKIRLETMEHEYRQRMVFTIVAAVGAIVLTALGSIPAEYGAAVITALMGYSIGDFQGKVRRKEVTALMTVSGEA